MATRRSTDDDDRPIRRRNGNDELSPKPRKKRKRKKADRRPVLLFVLIGSAAVLLLAVGAVVIIRSNTQREQNPVGGTAGRPSGESGSASGVSLGAELLTNGNFEDGPEPDADGPGFTPYEAGSTAIPGWEITRGSVDYIGPYWQHADGRRSIDLNGNEPGAIAQTIRTRPGRKYRVTFSLAGNAFVGAELAVKVVIVSAAGVRGEFTFDTTARSYEDMGWATRTWEFTAVAAETTLEFASATDTPAAAGPALDRTSVKEIVK